MRRSTILLAMLPFCLCWVARDLPAQSITVRGSIALGTCTAVAARGELAYVARTNIFNTLDISDPMLPTVLGTVATGATTVRQLRIAHPYAYGAADASGLLIVDIYNQAAPTVLSLYSISSAVKSIAVRDTFVVLATPTFVALIGVRDRAHPHLKATYGRAATAVEFDPTAQRIYCGSTTGAFALNIVGPTGSDSSFSLTAGPTYGSDGMSPMTAVGSYLDYARGSIATVLATPNLTFTAQYTTTANIRALKGMNTYAFLALSNGAIHWIDQSRNGLPDVMATATITGDPSSIGVAELSTAHLIAVSHTTGVTLLQYDTSSSAVTERPAIPASLELTNFPNPFNGTTELQLSVSRPGLYRLQIIDALGRAVEQRDLLLSGTSHQSLHFAGRAAGVYFAQLQGAGQSVSTKLLYLP